MLTHKRLTRFARGGLVAVAILTAGLMSMPFTASAALGDWSPGPNAAGSNTYAGQIDLPTPGAVVFATGEFEIRGWVVDQSAQGWAGIDDMDVYDGIAGAGGTFLGKAIIAQPRTDVSDAFSNPYWAASGFRFTVRGGTLAAGPHQLTVYAHTPGKGYWYQQVTVNIAVSADQAKFPSDPMVVIDGPDEQEKVDTSKDYTLNGYALDRNALSYQGAGVDRVQLYLGGERGSSTAIYLGDATLNHYNAEAAAYGAQFNNAGWEFTFSPTHYTSGDTELWAYARSTVTGQETKVRQWFTIYDVPATATPTS